MANEENLKPKDSNQSQEEAKRNGKKGGIASGEARRLNARLANLTKHTDRLSLTKLKRKLRKLWKVRKDGFKEGDTKIAGEQVRDEIRDIIENIRIVKDCGGDVLNIVAIANNPYLAVSKPEVVIKAQSELWDRTEGKAIQSVVTTGSRIRETVVVTQEELDEEALRMQEEFDND